MPAKRKSIEQLRQELAAQQKLLTALKAKRAKLAGELAKLDGRIAAVAGEGKPRNGRRKGAKAKLGRPKKAAGAKVKLGRPKKAAGAKVKLGRPKKAAAAKPKRRRATGKPLVAYLRQVLAGKTKGMRAKDVSVAVAKAGYKSFSKDFYGIVATGLRDKKNFKNLRRGVYTLA